MSSLTSYRSRAIGVFLAIISAGAAVDLFSVMNPAAPGSRWRLSLNLALMLTAMALFAWAALPPVRQLVAGQRKQEASFHRWAYVLALAVYGLSLAVVLAVGENGLVRLLWLGGMILLVLATFNQDDIPRLNRSDGRDILLLVGITAVAFVLRFWRLPELPLQFHMDIATQGLQALELLGNPNRSWFDVGWSNIPTFDFMMMAGSMKLFGTDLFGLSMTAVIQGVLTIPALYLLGRELSGRWVGLLAAALLAISYTHIHFSRIVTTASPLLFACLTFYFLFRGLHQRRNVWFALAGISMGIGLLTYYPSRVVVIVVVLLFLWMLIWKREIVADLKSGWITLGAGALLGFGPMLAVVLFDFGAFVGRGNLVTLWNPTVMAHLMGKYGVDSVNLVWLEQFKRTFLTFFLYPDASTHFGFPGPIVNAMTATLLILGLGYSLRWLRDERYFTLVIWLLATLLLGGVSTNDPPFWPHLVIALPAVMLLAAIAAERSWKTFVEILPDGWRRSTGVALATALALMVVIVGIGNWQTYVKYADKNASVDVRVARHIAALPSDRVVRLVMDPLNWHQPELAFMGRHLRGNNITTEQVRTGTLQSPQQPTLFALSPNHSDLLPALRTLFPTGSSDEHRAGNGQIAFYTYEVEPESNPATSEPVDPVKSLRTRRLVVWASASLALLFLFLLGLLILLRQPPSSASHSSEEDEQRSTARSSIPHDQLRRIGQTMGAALILAFLAQYLFDSAGPLSATGATPGTGWLIAGAILYVAAMVLFAWAAPTWQPFRSAPQQSGPTTLSLPAKEFAPDARIMRPGAPTQTAANPVSRTSVFTPSGVRWQVGLFVLAIIPYALSLLLFQINGENSFVRWLWLIGLLIFLGGQVIRPAVHRVAGRNAEWSPRFRWWHIVILLAILAVSFWLRFNHLADIPHDLHGDMASMGIQARDWLSGRQPNLFQEGWANIPMVGFLPSAIFLSLFGNDLFALNFSAVVGGMLVLLGLYLLVWRLFDSHRLAALATAALAVNIPHIHFSRLAAYMDPWPFLIFAMFFLVDGMRARRPQSFALAGVLLGIGVQMYYSGRVIAIILIVSFIYLLIVRPRWLRDNLLGLGLLFVGTFIALGPSLLYFADNWEAFAERSRSVLVFYEPVMTHLQLKYGLGSDAAVILEQIKRSLLVFNHSIDSSSQFGFKHPMFSNLLSPLIPLGFAYALRRWRTPGLGLSLIWLMVLIIFGSVLTNNAPFWPRLVGALPVAALLVALPLDRIWLVLVELAPRPSRSSATVVLGLAAFALFIFTGQSNWILYEKTVIHNARPNALVGRYLATLPEQIAACGFGSPGPLQVRETAFLAWPRPLLDLPADAPAGLLDRCPGPPFVWILAADDMNHLAELQTQWPGGQLQEHLLANSVPAFISYLVMDNETLTHSPASQITPDTFTAYLPDGSPLTPRHVYRGDSSSTAIEIEAGRVEIEDGRLTVFVTPLSDHDAVFDYVKLVTDDGNSFQFEAEDTTITTGDVFSSRQGWDNHWWLQAYDPFSGGYGLVASKQEIVPVLATTVEVPNGNYTLSIGTFTGDSQNGIFGLGIGWETVTLEAR